jgi:restriction system protein
MFGFGAFGEFAFGEGPPIVGQLTNSTNAVALSVSALIIPDNSLLLVDRQVAEGRLVSATSLIWTRVAKQLANDWTLAQQLTPDQWEEMVAGAFKGAGYDVVITPRSGDHGRDVIATTRGVGCVKIIGSVKAYRPGRLVPYDAIRSLVGVISGDLSVSKGIITTTTDFPPLVHKDPYISPFLPTRLELVNGEKLQQWLTKLSQTKRQQVAI